MVKDSAVPGNAAANNITIVPPVGDTIEGDSFLVISGNGDAVSLKRNPTTRNWEVF